MECVVCQKRNFTQYLSAKALDDINSPEYSYQKCLNCGLVVLALESQRYDPSIYADSGNYSNEPPRFSKAIFSIMSFFYKRRLKALEKVCQVHQGTLLDIGCGKGEFLRVAKENGWEVFGLEPTQSRAEMARKNYGLRVVNAPLDHSLFKPESFDAVTLWHVFEHLPSPREALEIVHDCLKPEGVLLIAIPNIDSWQAMIGKERWFHLEAPRHLFHYSPDTITQLLQEHGFIVKKIGHFFFEHNFWGMVQTCLNRIGAAPNLLFNYLKKNKKGLSKPPRLYVELILHFFVLSLGWLPFYLLSLAESIKKRGGTILVTAVKK